MRPTLRRPFVLALAPVAVLAACFGDDPTGDRRPTLALPADTVFDLSTTVSSASIELGDPVTVRAILRNRSTQPQVVAQGGCGVLPVPEDVGGSIIGEAVDARTCPTESPADTTLSPGDSIVSTLTWTHRGASANPRAYTFLRDTLVRFRAYALSRKAIFFDADAVPVRVTETKNVGAEPNIGIAASLSKLRLPVGDTVTVSVLVYNLRGSDVTLTFTSNCAARVQFTSEDAPLSTSVTACADNLKTFTLRAFEQRAIPVKWKTTLPTGSTAAVLVRAIPSLGVTSPDRVLVGPPAEFVVDR